MKVDRKKSFLSRPLSNITTSNHSPSSKYVDPYIFNSIFPSTNKIHHSLKRCRRNRRLKKPYRCYQYWCTHCSRDQADDNTKLALDFSKQLQQPAFVTILLLFISSPTPKVWKRKINKAINLIDLPGLWWPEIAFKKDKVMDIADKGYGYDKQRQYLLHLHGIIDMKDRNELKAVFNKSNQCRVELIGKGHYAAKSMEENISAIAKYCTKKDYRKNDIAIIERNPTGFGYRITKRQ